MNDKDTIMISSLLMITSIILFSIGLAHFYG